MPSATISKCPFNPSSMTNRSTPPVISSCPFASASQSQNPLAKNIAQLLGAPHLNNERLLENERPSAVSGVRRYESVPTPANFNYEVFRRDQHEYITSLHDALGDIIRVRIEGNDFVFVRNPKTVKRVLTSEGVDFTKTFADADDKSTNHVQYFKNLVQPLLASAEIFGSGDNYDRRQGLKSVFIANKTFLPEFQNVCQRMVCGDDWHQGRLNLADTLHPLVFQLVMSFIAGEDAEGADELVQAAQTCLNHFISRYTVPNFDEKISTEDEAAMKLVEEAGMKVTLAFRLKAATGQLTKLQQASMLGVTERFNLSDVEANATMINALFAACEAPIHVLASALMEVAKDSQLQRQVVSELESNPDVLKSKSLNGILMEALRLHSPVTIVQRRTTENVVLDGYAIPKDTNIVVCIDSAHFNESIYKNARTFDPTRPGLNMVILSGKNAFMPFSGGPRGCPGRHLAATLMKAALGSIITRFELSESHNSQSDLKVYKFVRYPANGAYVHLELRRNGEKGFVAQSRL